MAQVDRVAKMYTLLLLLPLLSIVGGEEVHVRVSEPATLVCPHNEAECGSIHSMKWYRALERVYVYSPFTDFSNPEAFLVDRSSVVESGSSSDLIINEALPTDDGEYRCEITYMDVSAACQSVFEYSLLTTALPAAVSLGVGEAVVLEVQRADLGPQHGVVGPYTFESEVEFYCLVEEVKPSASVLWLLGGQETEATDSEVHELEGGASSLRSTLVLTLGRDHLATTLTCRVMFEEEALTELSVEMDIEVAPVELSLDVPDLAAEEAGQLVCRVAGGRPEAAISWSGPEGIDFDAIRSDEDVLEDDMTFTQTSTITLTAKPEHHAQTISCSAEHQALPESLEQAKKLNVAYAPVVAVEVHEDQIVEGQTLEIKCQFNANPRENATITWFLNSEELSAEDEAEFTVDDDGVDTLILEYINRTRAGEYMCRVVNTEGEGLSEPVMIDVLYPPSNAIESDMNTVVEGSKLELRCPFSANPYDTAVVTWIYDAEELSDVDSIKFDVNENDINVLTIEAANRDHSGEYSCKVENDIGESVSDLIYIDVQYPPTVGLEWDSEPFIEGEKLELKCPFSANPDNSSFVTWYYNSEELSLGDNSSIVVDVNDEGIDMLMFENLNHSMSGVYQCSVSNELGEGLSDTLMIDVLYPPDVELTLSPSDGIVEEMEENITLTCSLVNGNPDNLTSVNWFLDGDLMELEGECSDTDCVLYIDGYRTSAGNYSCQGNNLAGSGPEEYLQLDILYAPGPGQLVEEEGIEKGGNATLFCDIEDYGNPQYSSFVWKKNGEVIDEEEEEYLILHDLTVLSEANYSCSGSNEIGTNFGDPVFLDVSAAPVMLESGPAEVYMQEDYQWVNLTCQVECSPLCSIDWYLNFVKITGGEVLVAEMESADDVELFKDYEASENEGSGLVEAEENLDLYVDEEFIGDNGVAPFTIFNEEIPIDLENMQFESLRSTLSIQLGNRTREMVLTFQLSNFTCSVDRGRIDDDQNEEEFEDLEEAEENGEEEVSATSMLIIEHMPLDIELSPDIEEISLVEDESMDDIHCSVLARPEAQIVWKLGDDVVSEDGTLTLSDPLTKEDRGEYSCEASNEYGSIQRSVYVDVQYSPSCVVSKGESEEEGVTVLKCSADGNPEDFLYWWTKDGINYDGQLQDGSSTISLKNVNGSVLSQYTCHVNNSIGQSDPCNLSIEGSLLSDDISLILLIVIIAVVVLLLAIIIYFKCCRNQPPKGAQKLPVDQPKKGQQPKKDGGFYDNLPFHGLKNPPKQVLNSVDDGLVYADVDAAETYSQGPVAYKTASLQRAKQKKLEESKL